jgi:hypothetical protein
MGWQTIVDGTSSQFINTNRALNFEATPEVETGALNAYD